VRILGVLYQVRVLKGIFSCSLSGSQLADSSHNGILQCYVRKKANTMWITVHT